MFTIKIETDNNAFAPYPGYEVARILRQVADISEEHGSPPDSLVVFDINGNKVGEVSYGD